MIGWIGVAPFNTVLVIVAVLGLRGMWRDHRSDRRTR